MAHEFRVINHSLRPIRRMRRRRVKDIAPALGLSERAYQMLEAGETSPTLDKVTRFAAATDSDALALILGGLIGSPAFGRRCADNKLGEIFLIQLRAFEAELGEDIARLDPRALMTAFKGVFDDLARYARSLPANPMPAAEPDTAADDLETLDLLTERQLQCLAWVQQGKSSRDIAAILGISLHTVELHLKEACRRLGVRSRVQAVAEAQRLGLLTLSTS